MSQIDLSRIEEIFHAALEIPAAERDKFLDRECGGDAELRHEVESLLELDSREDEILDGSPAELAAELIAVRRGHENKSGGQIGHYSVVRLLGTGGMGEVYLAEDTRLGRKVAIKILPAEFALDDGRLKRFELEARSASALNHPNILTIHEIGEADGVRFIATEYVDGRTLKDVLRDGRLAAETALDIAVQIASALDEAHSSGIVHRDIKPDNVMVRPNGLVKILDFGVAKFLGTGAAEPSGAAEGTAGPGKTQAGAIIGTAEYMSPEQARGGQVDRRSDIFSFGAVLYEMLSGKKAFPGDDAADAIESILNEDPKPIAEVVPSIPSALAAMIDKCLIKEPCDRYQRIGEVLAELRVEIRRLERDSVETNRTTGIIAAAVTQDGIGTAHVVSTPSRRGLYAAVSLVVLLIAFGTFVGYSYLSNTTQIESIAVVPFSNESGDPEIDYLSDGMTDNLIRSLSTLQGLSVKARSTVFTYKGRDVAPKTIGEELNVDAILLGRLKHSGDGLRLDLELVETASQNVLWSAEYSRGLDDLVLLQRDIARDVSGRLRPALTAADKTRITQNYSTNSEAQQLYLKGRFHWNKRTVSDFEKAIVYFDQAVEKDPNYALAYAGAADAYALMPLYGNFHPLEYIPKAKQAALRALELDPDLAEAHASLGYIITTNEYDWDRAERAYLKAIELRPNYATAHQWYAEHLAFRGRTDEALANISIALELDPFSLVINRMKGNILGFAKRHDEAIEQLVKTVELYPESPIVRFNLGEAYAAKGMFPEAIEQFLTGFRLDGRKNHEIRRYENAYKLKGWKGFWMEYLASLITLQNALVEAEQPIYFDNESLAYAYAATGNKDKALDYLFKAYEARDPLLVTIRTSEVYDFLRDDPRYLDLIGKIGLPK